MDLQFRYEMLIILISFGLGMFFVMLAGRRRIKNNFQIFAKQVPLSSAKILAASAVIALLLPVMAVPYVDKKSYIVFAAYLVVGSFCYLSLILLLTRFDRLARGLFGVIERCNVYLLAALFLVLTTAAALAVLNDMPHISDEVVYQFQARTFASGRLFNSPPPLREFFAFPHIILDDAKWYGIPFPGWPFILVLGYLIHAPWIVNPILGAVTLLIFFSFYRAAGYSLMESKISVLLLGISPFVLFMSASYMSHTANLFLFAVFCWAWVKMYSSGARRFAFVAGFALGINVLVRPTDSVATAVPFLILLTIHSFRKRRFIQHICIVVVMVSLFAGLMLLYNRLLTGQYTESPIVKYSTDLGLGQMGLGFGPNMGTKLHGPEWPGYYPSDAIRVSSYRLSEMFQDFNGLPLLLVAACLFAAMRKRREREQWDTLLLASALCLFIVYGFHFYHGIAFGARHYYLAAPALAVMIAGPLGRWISGENQTAVYLAKISLVGLLLYIPIFSYPRLILRYGNNYRGTSTAIRDYIKEQPISNALIFVHPSDWAWKSAFPLNSYPLEQSSIIFAKDLEEQNQHLIDQFPGRNYYYLRLIPKSNRVEVKPVTITPSQNGNGPGQDLHKQ